MAAFYTKRHLMEHCTLKRFFITLSFLAILPLLGCGGSLPEGTSPDASKGYVAPYGMDAIVKSKAAMKIAKKK
jgi:hypothetical protein